jgi:hypothetical protein
MRKFLSTPYGLQYINSLLPYSVNQVSKLMYGDFLSSSITYDTEFAAFLSISDVDEHDLLWMNRDFARQVYERFELDPESDFTDLVRLPNYRVLWDTNHINKNLRISRYLPYSESVVRFMFSPCCCVPRTL